MVSSCTPDYFLLAYSEVPKTWEGDAGKLGTKVRSNRRMSPKATIGTKSLLSEVFLTSKEDLGCLCLSPCNGLHDFIFSHISGELGYLLAVAHDNDTVASA